MASLQDLFLFASPVLVACVCPLSPHTKFRWLCRGVRAANDECLLLDGGLLVYQRTPFLMQFGSLYPLFMGTNNSE